MAVALGNGATLKVGSAATPTQLVANLTTVSFDGFKVSTVETSALSSTYKTFIPGLLEGGSISITCNSDTSDTGQSLLTTNMLAKTLTYFILTFADGSIIGGTTGDTAYVDSYKTDASVDSVQMATWTLKTTGTLQVA
jgi:hypothetical protein